MARRDSRTGGPSFRMDLESSSSSSSSSSSFSSDADSSFTSPKPLGIHHTNIAKLPDSSGTKATNILIKHTKRLDVSDGILASPPAKFSTLLPPHGSLDQSQDEDEEAYSNISVISNDEGMTFKHLNDSNFHLPINCWNYLYSHQKTGVKWLANKNLEQLGCMLSDEMGMGKTVQTCSALGGLFSTGSAQLALISSPLGLTKTWIDELKSTLGRINEGIAMEEAIRRRDADDEDEIFEDESLQQRQIEVSIELISSEQSARERKAVVEECGKRVKNNNRHNSRYQKDNMRYCCVVVCGHSMLESICDLNPGDGWDALILDEGHKIKSIKTNISQSVRAIQTRWRLLITGTYIQNDLKELYSLLSFLDKPIELTPKANHLKIKSSLNNHNANFYHGTAGYITPTVAGMSPQDNDEIHLFHGYQEFRNMYARPIEKARCLNASIGERKTGNKCALMLRKVLSKRILQRFKKDMNENSKKHKEVLKQAQKAAATSSTRGETSLSKLNSHTKLSSSSSALIELEQHQEAEELPPKHEVVLWIGLSNKQKSRYETFLNSGKICALRNGDYSHSPLAALTQVLKLSNHWILASKVPPKAKKAKKSSTKGDQGSDSDQAEEEEDDDDDDDEKGFGESASSDCEDGDLLDLTISNDEDIEDFDFDGIFVNWNDTVNLPTIPYNGDDERDAKRLYGSGLKAKISACLGDYCGGVTANLSHLSPEEVMSGSAKLSILLPMLNHFAENGHRTIIFSKTVRALHLIEHCLSPKQGYSKHDFQVLRIDGTVGYAERQRRVTRFQSAKGTIEDNDKAAKTGLACMYENSMVMLITTGVGSLGLTLTAADRVIMFNPSWNPSEDAQAVDRAHRIGQKRQVITYRMMCAGTVEAKVYEKQVFKDGLRRTLKSDKADNDEDEESEVDASLNSKQLKRYFTRAEIKNVFTYCKPSDCETLKRLIEAHGTTENWIERISTRPEKNTNNDTDLSHCSSSSSSLDHSTSTNEEDVGEYVECKELIKDFKFLEQMRLDNPLLIDTTPHNALYTVYDTGDDGVSDTEDSRLSLMNRSASLQTSSNQLPQPLLTQHASQLVSTAVVPPPPQLFLSNTAHSLEAPPLDDHNDGRQSFENDDGISMDDMAQESDLSIEAKIRKAVQMNSSEKKHKVDSFSSTSSSSPLLSSFGNVSPIAPLKEDPSSSSSSSSSSRQSMHHHLPQVPAFSSTPITNQPVDSNTGSGIGGMPPGSQQRQSIEEYNTAIETAISASMLSGSAHPPHFALELPQVKPEVKKANDDFWNRMENNSTILLSSDEEEEDSGMVDDYENANANENDDDDDDDEEEEEDDGEIIDLMSDDEVELPASHQVDSTNQSSSLLPAEASSSSSSSCSSFDALVKAEKLPVKKQTKTKGRKAPAKKTVKKEVKAKQATSTAATTSGKAKAKPKSVSPSPSSSFSSAMDEVSSASTGTRSTRGARKLQQQQEEFQRQLDLQLKQCGLPISSPVMSTMASSTRCLSMLSPNQVHTFQKLVLQGSDFIKQANSIKKKKASSEQTDLLSQALETCLEALALADDQVYLHGMIVHLKQRLSL